jgi:hypothetical protein
MDEITIVRRRTRVMPIVLMLIVVALLVLAGLWMLGMLPGLAAPVLNVDYNSEVTPLGVTFV